MARSKNDAIVDLSKTHELSVGLIERVRCTPDLPKVLLRDKDVTGLKVRVTANGAKSFIYEARLNGERISKTLGPFPLMTISEAKDRARDLAKLVKTERVDPRVVERQQVATAAAQAEVEKVASVTVGEIWPRYLIEGKPKRKQAFKPRYLADLKKIAAPGGVDKVRGKGKTRPGPLFLLMALPLALVNEDALASWYDTECKAGEHQAARALMMFRGFLRWCSARPEYRAITDRDAGKAAAIVENLPSNTRRTDAIEAAQLPGWWSGVDQLGNRTASIYLRALLLTGARREELAALRWADVDFQWRRLTLADKVEATRTIPLTPYLAQQLAILRRVNEFVFASSGKVGRITDTRSSHAKALKSAGIDRLTIHGLRRSFSLLGEAAGAPAGAIAQVMGHKPSATAEGYRPRSVDALRPYLSVIESYILAGAGVKFDPDVEP